MPDFWDYQFKNPPNNTAPDWTRRAFAVQVEGEPEVLQAVEPKDTQEIIVVRLPESKHVVLQTVDYDNAEPTPLSTRSEPLAFFVNDDVPPAIPGAPEFLDRAEAPA